MVRVKCPRSLVVVGIVCERWACRMRTLEYEGVVCGREEMYVGVGYRQRIVVPFRLAWILGDDVTIWITCLFCSPVS